MVVTSVCFSGPDSGSEQPGAEEPSTSNMEQDHVSRNIHHGQHLEQVGYHKPSKSKQFYSIFCFQGLCDS